MNTPTEKWTHSMLARGNYQPQTLSRIFLRLSQVDAPAISVQDIQDALRDRSFAAMLIFFGLLNCLPLPPGTSAILGIPLVIISAQMVMGRKSLWLPQAILKKSIERDRFRRGTRRVVPWLIRLERIVKPRYWPFAKNAADRPIGLLCLFLSILVVIPVPLGNAPPAFAISVISLALSERDGSLMALGLFLTLMATGVFVVFGFAIFYAVS